MLKKLFIVTLLGMFVLSACSGGGNAEPTLPAVTDTLLATAEVPTTQAAPATETFTLTPDGTAVTFTPTVGTVQPTNDPNCTNSATFVADITIPDDTTIGAATAFTKTWRIGNNGTCVWGPGYSLTHYSEERMGAPDAVPLPITYPGANADISVNLTAPNSTGRHQANFVIKGPGGSIIKIGDDSRLWVVINVAVGDVSAATPTTAATASTSTATSAPATFAPATLAPPATAGGAATATRMPAAATAGSSNPGSGTASCLFTIDRAKMLEVIQAVNAYRAEKGLATFSVSPKLAQAAQTHASDMACNQLKAHEGSDQSTPQTRVKAAGYTATSVAENVYTSNPPFTGEGVVNSWVTDSVDPNNNRNLLSTTFTQIGVGYAQFSGSGYYVLVFAKP